MRKADTPNVYKIPANYSDSGKWLGGLIDQRRGMEAALLVLVIGLLEFGIPGMDGVPKVFLMVFTLMPIAVLALAGINGDSLFQFMGYLVRWIGTKRIIIMRRHGRYTRPIQKRKEQYFED